MSILGVAYYFGGAFLMLSGMAGGVFCIFTCGYTCANIVRYRSEHDGSIDLVEVLRQMSPKSKQTDNDEDLEVEYILTQDQEEIEIIGDNYNDIEIV